MNKQIDLNLYFDMSYVLMFSYANSNRLLA